MGLVFEELIRRFAESSNETAGEHFTPRDIVRLTTGLIFSQDDDALNKEGVIRTIYDPTAGQAVSYLQVQNMSMSIILKR
jgi:type I restriction enzyme M protein